MAIPSLPREDPRSMFLSMCSHAVGSATPSLVSTTCSTARSSRATQIPDTLLGSGFWCALSENSRISCQWLLTVLRSKRSMSVCVHCAPTQDDGWPMSSTSQVDSVSVDNDLQHAANIALNELVYDLCSAKHTLGVCRRCRHNRRLSTS